MDYTVVKVADRFGVLEVTDQLIIKTYGNKKAAERAAHFLNEGAGFNGFTPPFFCEQYSLALGAE